LLIKTGSENDSPTMFMEDQLYIILVLKHGGYDMESYIFTNAEQTHSVLIQVLSLYFLYFASVCVPCSHQIEEHKPWLGDAEKKN
jgi:hypothetical protein